MYLTVSVADRAKVPVHTIFMVSHSRSCSKRPPEERNFSFSISNEPNPLSPDCATSQ